MSDIRYSLALSALLLATAATAQVQTPPTGSAPPPAPQAPAPPAATPTESVPYGAGLKVPLSPDGSKYIRFITWHQVWTRFNQNNSGSQHVPGDPQRNTFDVGLRRSRLILYAQLNPRFMILTHIGINNQNAVGGGVGGGIGDPGKKPQLFVHEAVVEYKVVDQLSIGAGLHYQNGISRMTRASTLNFLAFDAPIANWPTIEKTDQFARWLGIYAKGRVGKFDYAVSVNDPFVTSLSATPTNVPTNVADYYPRNSHKTYQGYFAYEFIDSESNLLPYAVGSYLGAKKVFNIGAGFLFNKDGMFSRPNPLPEPSPGPPADPFSIPFKTHNLGIWSADIFFDTPLNKDAGTAFTTYAVYYNYNFGPNYVRNIGIMNPSSAGGSAPIPGAGTLRGNAFPVVGTGSAVYAQAGYLLPKSTLGPKARLQPYAAWLHGDYDGLRAIGARRVNMVDLGANVLLDGHNAKFTINYRARPDYSNPQNINYRPEITLQTMVFL